MAKPKVKQFSLQFSRAEADGIGIKWIGEDWVELEEFVGLPRNFGIDDISRAMKKLANRLK